MNLRLRPEVCEGFWYRPPQDSEAEPLTLESEAKRASQDAVGHLERDQLSLLELNSSNLLELICSPLLRGDEGASLSGGPKDRSKVSLQNAALGRGQALLAHQLGTPDFGCRVNMWVVGGKPP
jgi:hypothetical protein